MNPSDFLTRSEFEVLDDDEKNAYIDRVSAAFTSSADAQSRLATIQHFFDIAAWSLTPEEYEKLRRRLWDKMWDDAEELSRTLANVNVDELTAEEFRGYRRVQEQVRAVVEHKQTLDELSEL